MKKINITIIIIRLLFFGEIRFVQVVLGLVPFVFFIIFYSFLLGVDILEKFESYMEESYVGIMGDLIVSSPSQDFMKSFKKEYLSDKASIKYNQTVSLGVKFDDFDFVKGFDLFVYEGSYLEHKFKEFNNDNKSIIINTVVAKQLNLSLGQHVYLYEPNSEVQKEFYNIVVVDLGFLNSLPIMMMSDESYEVLFGKEVFFNQIEFNGLSDQDKLGVINTAKRVFNQGTYSSYKIIDVKNLTDEHRIIFNSLNFISYLIFTVIMSLNIILALLAVKMVLSTKFRSFETLKLIGMSTFVLWSNLIYIWIGIVVATFISSYLTLYFTKSIIFIHLF